MKFLDINYYNEILNSLDDGILTLSKDKKIIFINNKALKLLEISNYNFEEINIFDIFSELEFRLNELIKTDKQTIENISLSNSKSIFTSDLIKFKSSSDDFGFLLVLKETKKLINTLNKLTTPHAMYVFDSIIGESPQIKKVIKAAKEISKSPSTVLITGESGSGKELLAQSIHNDSFRMCEPFIAVNCGALPKSLIESELFGYEEGSFTGAKKGGRAGKFELANGGTIFLD
ncbi:sigma 54-interacting transcriptional regulator, partial [Clostridium botulinum]